MTGREQDLVKLGLKALWANLREEGGHPIFLSNLQATSPPLAVSSVDDGGSSRNTLLSTVHRTHCEQRRQHLCKARNRRRHISTPAPPLLPAPAGPPAFSHTAHRQHLLVEARRMRRLVSGRHIGTTTTGAACSPPEPRQEGPEAERDNTGAGSRGAASVVLSFSFVVFVLFAYAWGGVSGNRREEGEEGVEGRELGGTNRGRAGRESPRRWGGPPARWPWLVSRSNTPNSRFLLFRHKWR